MAAVNYGTVAIVPKGEYSGETQYNVGNLVSYSGSSYVAKMIPPVGTLPTDTSYWQLSAQGGGTATENDLGVVKPDNTTIGIEEDGTLKSILTSALLPSTDTSGLLGQANATVNTQALIDAIADKIMTKLVTDDALTTRLANYVAKSMMTGVQVNSSDKVPTSALAYAMNELITGLREDVDSLNSDIRNKVDAYPKQLSSPPTETGNISYFFNVTANWSNGITASSKGFFVSFGADAVVIAANYQHLWFSFRNNGSWIAAVQVK